MPSWSLWYLSIRCWCFSQMIPNIIDSYYVVFSCSLPFFTIVLSGFVILWQGSTVLCSPCNRQGLGLNIYIYIYIFIPVSEEFVILSLCLYQGSPGSGRCPTLTQMTAVWCWSSLSIAGDPHQCRTWTDHISAQAISVHRAPSSVL
jgi:hypothetical protein